MFWCTKVLCTFKWFEYKVLKEQRRQSYIFNFVCIAFICLRRLVEYVVVKTHWSHVNISRVCTLLTCLVNPSFEAKHFPQISQRKVIFKGELSIWLEISIRFKASRKVRLFCCCLDVLGDCRFSLCIVVTRALLQTNNVYYA